jgi:predicted phage terminase large subunit-like protein
VNPKICNLETRDLPSLDQIDKVLAEKYLRQFIRQSWHIVEPGATFVNNWHIDAICDHLQAVALSFTNDAIERGKLEGTVQAGAIRRLIINIPPRHMKSLSVSVMFPAWLWARLPWLRFLFMSYAESLSIRDSVKCRRIIQSDWYQARWGAYAPKPKKGIEDRRVILTGDQNAKSRFENTQTGQRIASSIDGMATGEGGDAIIVDDPHNVKDTQSVSGTALNNVINWWDEVMPTRLNDLKTGVKVIIMQRCHEKDLTGHILGKEHDYEHLCLPARFEVDHKYKWAADPRSIDGEVLWRGKVDEKELTELEKDLSSYAKAGQLQQRPAPREGGMLKREWFEIVPADRVPKFTGRLRWWDMAATKKVATNDPDFTSGALLGITAEQEVYIINVNSSRESSFSTEKLIKQTAELDGKAVAIWMEQEPGSAGKTICEQWLRKLIGYAFRYEPSTGAKEAFVDIFSAGAERGIVKIVGAPSGGMTPTWIEPFLDEACAFPNAAHDDKVESVAKAYCKITAKGQIGMRVI